MTAATPEGAAGRVGAGFWIRALARILDSLWGVVLGFLALVLAGVLLAVHGAPGTPEQWLAAAGRPGVRDFFASVVAGTAYGIVCEYSGGASLGKLLCGLRVIAVDGGPLHLRGAIVRNLAYFIDSFLFGAVAWVIMKPPLMQRLGDRWGGTLVVRRADAPAGSTHGLGLALLGIAMASLLWMAPAIHRVVTSAS